MQLVGIGVLIIMVTFVTLIYEAPAASAGSQSFKVPALSHGHEVGAQQALIGADLHVVNEHLHDEEGMHVVGVPLKPHQSEQAAVPRWEVGGHARHQP